MSHCLVFGASGQVATALSQRFAAAGRPVTVLGRAEVDLSDPVAAREAIIHYRPHIVINAAAYTAVDRAETESAAAYALNATGPAAAAAAAAEIGAPFIHFSDYVFDGSKGAPYAETDPTAPLGVYGASKLAGEQGVAAANPAHVILRTAWVCSAGGANFLRTMLRLAADRDEIGVVDDQRGQPTFADDLADGVLRIVDRLERTPPAEAWGVFHLSGADDTTWCGFASEIMDGSRARGGPAARIRPIATADYPTPVRRPADSRLDCRRIESVYGISPRPWRAELDRCLDQIYSQPQKGPAS